MKCEMCHNHDATVHFKQVVDGRVQEVWICRGCAESQGLNLESPQSLTDFFFGASVESQPVPPDKDHACPVCAMKLSDFRRLSRLGCRQCYPTFQEDVETALNQLQDGDRHLGKIPVRERISVEIAQLEDALASAIQAQQFEDAARIRDELRDIRAGHLQGNGLAASPAE